MVWEKMLFTLLNMNNENIQRRKLPSKKK
jgi:hypothetical protein